MIKVFPDFSITQIKPALVEFGPKVEHIISQQEKKPGSRIIRETVDFGVNVGLTPIFDNQP